MNIVVRKYHRLMRALALFISVIETQRSLAHPNRWSQAGESLKRDLEILSRLAVLLKVISANTIGVADSPVSQGHSHNDESMSALLKSTVQRLTQLARTQDGWSVAQFDSASAERLTNSRRTVVIAAWHLLQSLQHLPVPAATIEQKRQSR